VIDCCLTPNKQSFSYIMTRTSKFSMRLWWGPLCTRPTRLFNSWILIVLADWNNSGYRRVAPLWHIILIPSKLVFALFPFFFFPVCIEEKQQISISEFSLGLLWGSCCSIFSFMCSVIKIINCPFVNFFLAIVLSVHLRFMASDYLLWDLPTFLKQCTFLYCCWTR